MQDSAQTEIFIQHKQPHKDIEGTGMNLNINVARVNF